MLAVKCNEAAIECEDKLTAMHSFFNSGGMKALNT